MFELVIELDIKFYVSILYVFMTPKSIEVSNSGDSLNRNRLYKFSAVRFKQLGMKH